MIKLHKPGNSKSSNIVIPRMDILSSPVISTSIRRVIHPFSTYWIVYCISNYSLESIFSTLGCCHNEPYFHVNLHSQNACLLKFMKKIPSNMEYITTGNEISTRTRKANKVAILTHTKTSHIVSQWHLAVTYGSVTNHYNYVTHYNRVTILSHRRNLSVVMSFQETLFNFILNKKQLQTN
jgi:hypothetical protein